MNHHFDIVIIGSGAGGGTLAFALAPSGKKILLIERGDFHKREKDNLNPQSILVENGYHAQEIWYDKEDRPFAPGINYCVGGNTKVYGAALLRLRQKDFSEIQHYGGLSPSWPLSYEEFQPYYLKAEKLYKVHGERKEDPTEPPESAPYPFPPIRHEPYIAQVAEALKKQNLHPFHLPLGLCLNEKNEKTQPCLRCDSCDECTCRMHAKSDAHISCVNPSLDSGNVTLLTCAKALRLIADSSGKMIKEVEVEKDGQKTLYSGDLIVVACGAVNSAALLLRSVHPKHPRGLANSSDVVGRHYMFHQNSVMVAVSSAQNPTKHEKTLALNDFYFNSSDSSFPLGHIQLLGNVKKEMLCDDASKFAPNLALKYIADHSVGWWLTSEDLPDPFNRVSLTPKGAISLNYTPNNQVAHVKLIAKLKEILARIDRNEHFFPKTLYSSQQIPIAGCAHQAGTIRFGKDPRTSALDLNCKAHDLDNLYVVDSSFFPSIGAVNPSLTIIANALRVAEKIKDRLGISSQHEQRKAYAL